MIFLANLNNFSLLLDNYEDEMIPIYEDYCNIYFLARFFSLIGKNSITNKFITYSIPNFS